MEWENFTCAYRILKQLMGKFTSQCSTLFSLLRVLDAGSISDMPLIIQIIVCIVLFVSSPEEQCTTWILPVRTVCASHGEQMGHTADVPGSSQTAHREEGKAKEKGKEVKAHHGMTIMPSSAQSSRSGYTVGQRKQTDCTCSGVSQCHDCTKLLMNINADLFVCTAVVVGWRFPRPATVLPSVELGNSDRLTIRQAKLCQADNIMKKNR